MRGAGISWVALGERVVGFVFLISIFPTLLLIGLFIRATAGRPVVLNDSVLTEEGMVAKSYRFRTTGEGTRLFRCFGRVMRKYGIDELPGLWSVACGDISFREHARWVRRRESE